MQGFEVLYQENRDRIYRYVYCWVGNREDAEDVTSQIFLKVWRWVDAGRSPKAIEKWLFQVARTTITDYWRECSRVSTISLERLLETADWDEFEQEESKTTANTSAGYFQRILPLLSTRSPEELLAVDQDDPDHEGLTVPESGAAGFVHFLLQALPEQYQEVLICRFLHGLSIKETALTMGLTVANVKVIQLRALKRAATLDRGEFRWREREHAVEERSGPVGEVRQAALHPLLEPNEAGNLEGDQGVELLTEPAGISFGA